MITTKRKTPKFEHDCSRCIFLGHSLNRDYYICIDEEPLLTTLIARYGKNGSYSSGIEFCWSGIYLNKALQLAYEQGYITGGLKRVALWQQIKYLDYLKHDEVYAKGIAERWGKRKRFLIPENETIKSQNKRN